jgi:hypothetical protein
MISVIVFFDWWKYVFFVYLIFIVIPINKENIKEVSF